MPDAKNDQQLPRPESPERSGAAEAALESEARPGDHGGAGFVREHASMQLSPAVLRSAAGSPRRWLPDTAGMARHGPSRPRRSFAARWRACSTASAPGRKT